ncbi:6-phosphogluconate dehydrogenase, decarboxylating [Alkaliphilus metalliredigens QYMF]|uniref:6-phosphogluconate dehydrogenase, decarboxylating n=1 Tax=Alkaliphilus metalliredigens (strain QYMF) TaxID=293826 RepID=A6TTS9_ALKMQ|nr:decarboxylating 6-phosphogluconate dehydrogenase [Alkaliphilus metalliredigens]ABR49597.1 6-phosphogluconate dehydrogenase, decarboxylating [Alkaliphilus metalliredigens QYMF]
MEIGLIGLGKMGYNLALNMRDHGHRVVAYNRTPDKTQMIEKEGIKGVYSLEALYDSLEGKRILWMMIPSGEAVDNMIDELLTFLRSGDILIDGGNSFYQDTLRRYEKLKDIGIDYIDVGTSGGIEGARTGACMMVGGEPHVVEQISSLFQDISIENGYSFMGTPGSGHYVKMVHNAIEYGMMQAIGEGFELLNAGPFSLDFENVAKVWSHGSIIEGLLMRCVLSSFEKSEKLEEIQGIVDASGEGQWAVEEALRLKVSMPVISNALFARYKSTDSTKFSEKVVAAMRKEFGGHAIHQK